MREILASIILVLLCGCQPKENDWQWLELKDPGPASVGSVECAADIMEELREVLPATMKDLAEDLSRFYANPYEYVLWAFPWGEPGTALQHHDGPRDWQKDQLIRLGKEIEAREFNGVDAVAPILMATASGHGIGKSAYSAWIIKFIMDTRAFAKGAVTANSAPQLRTKTWAELGKWHRMSITEPFFEYRCSSGNMCLYAKEAPESWRVDGLTCRKENSESFAGLHSAGSTPFYLFDEASAIHKSIWEVAHGGLTDGEPMWFVFGNPTQNTGDFRECFGRMKHRWITSQIDSRDVEGTNKELFAEWVQDYGEDSDFVRVRVKGQFPRSAVCQLMPSDVVQAARGKHLPPHTYNTLPAVLGVDVAWYGDDRSCIWWRQGKASTLLWQGREVDSITLAGLVAQYEDERKTDATFIDAGMGNGVIDQLRHMGRNPVAVYFGSRSINPRYANKRAEMWGNMKDWLVEGAAIPDEQEIEDDLTAPEYSMTLNGEIILEKKEHMKSRGLCSPDLADGLALTFASPVHAPDKMPRGGGNDRVAAFDYEVI